MMMMRSFGHKCEKLGQITYSFQSHMFSDPFIYSELIRLELESDKVVHEERLLDALQQRIRGVRQGPERALYVLIRKMGSC